MLTTPPRGLKKKKGRPRKKDGGREALERGGEGGRSGARKGSRFGARNPPQGSIVRRMCMFWVSGFQGQKCVRRACPLRDTKKSNLVPSLGEHPPLPPSRPPPLISHVIADAPSVRLINSTLSSSNALCGPALEKKEKEKKEKKKRKRKKREKGKKKKEEKKRKSKKKTKREKETNREKQKKKRKRGPKEVQYLRDGPKI